MLQQKFKWDAAAVQKLTEMAKAGLPASRIAAALGTTKSAVLGKLHRNKSIPRNPRNTPSRRSPPKPRKPRREVPDNLDTLFEQSGGKAFADGRRFILSGHEPVAFASLGPAQCRFPVSAPDEPCGPEMRCCGAERRYGPYCAVHAEIAHQRGAA